MSVVSTNPYDPITPEQWAELRRRWPSAERLRLAWELASDIDTCAELLAGYPVDRDRLDKDVLVWAHERRLVTLSCPIELVDVAEASA